VHGRQRVTKSLIPDTAKEKPSQGEVIAVGPGGRDESGKLIPIDLKVGDTVLFGKWSGTEVKIDGQDLLIMKESDIMGVIEGGLRGIDILNNAVKVTLGPKGRNGRSAEEGVRSGFRE
jgi:chaperonin GroES